MLEISSKTTNALLIRMMKLLAGNILLPKQKEMWGKLWLRIISKQFLTCIVPWFSWGVVKVVKFHPSMLKKYSTLESYLLPTTMTHPYIEKSASLVLFSFFSFPFIVILINPYFYGATLHLQYSLKLYFYYLVGVHDTSLK